MHSARRHELGVSLLNGAMVSLAMHSARRHELGEGTVDMPINTNIDAFRAET